MLPSHDDVILRVILGKRMGRDLLGLFPGLFSSHHV